MSFADTAPSDVKRKGKVIKQEVKITRPQLPATKRLMPHVGDASNSMICSAASVLRLFKVDSYSSSVSDAVRFIEDFGN